MNDFEYCVSLWIEHPSINPAIITSTLGIVPRSIRQIGERRRTPKGRLLEGTYAKSYWSSDLDVVDGEDVAESLGAIAATLRPHHDFLCTLADEGGLIQLFFGLFATGLCDYILPHNILQELADLRIDLRFDFYGGQGESNPNK